MRGRFLFVALAAWCSVACQATPNLGAICTRDSDCTSPYVCRFGRCRAECTTTRDCPAGARCLVAGGLGSCSLDVDERCESGGHACAPGLTCLGDRCVNTCTRAADCPPDAMCLPAVGTMISFCFVPGLDDASVPTDAPIADTGPPIDAGLADSGVCGASGCGAASSLCVGDSFACAVRELDDHVVCWGSDASGQLGDGTTRTTLGSHPLCASGERCSARPVEVLSDVDGMPITAHQVVCGESTACAYVGNEVRCWGGNTNGEAGTPNDAPFYARAVAVTLPGLTAPLAQLLAMRSVFCAQTEIPSGRLTWCWGLDNDDVLGLGSTSADVPVPPTHVMRWDGQALALGDGHICGLDPSTSTVQCAGNHLDGELGSDWLTSAPTGPIAISFGTPRASAVVAGAHFSAALVGGAPWTWGSNAVLSLGRASTGTCADGPCAPEPDLVALQSPITTLWAAGFDDMICAQSADRTWCWGGTDRDGCFFEHGDCTAPVEVPALGGAAVVAGGARSLCAIDASHTVICFGQNAAGALAGGTSEVTVVDSSSPVHVCIDPSCP